MDAASLQKVFGETFPEQDQCITVSAPGRVNLIGEHTDYNDGFVLPMAIDAKILLVGALRRDTQVRVYSVDFDESDSFDLQCIASSADRPWSNYIRGVCKLYPTETQSIPGGMDLVMQGNVPQGAGLSSSAALEIGTAVLIRELNGFSADGVTLAKLAQRAENEFVGVQCGIMDQFISILGEKDHALFVDCRSLDYERVPAPFKAADASIVVIDTGVKRGLVDSKYNERRQQCQEAVEALRTWQPELTSLRDVTPDLKARIEQLPAVSAKRARHVVSENERVLKSVRALKQGELQRFGQYMNASHDSLRDDYEVSCRELDLLVDLVRDNPETYGSRMTGAGFGGCTVSLVPTKEIPDIRSRVLSQYEKETGLAPRMFVFQAAAGARRV